MPAVQCKDTLLLDYDYSKQYSKRTVVNNWDKYAELRDDDDDNGQLSAADYEQLLTASKAIGDHFTFAAERSWLQSDQSTEEGSLAAELFKLNISNLETGLSRLPFYVRQDLPNEMFTNGELSDMDHRANFFEIDKSHKPPTESQMNQKILNILTSGASKLENTVENTIENKLPTPSIDTQISKLSLNAKSTASASPSGPIKPQESTKSNKTEDIQDWLDDILNEN